MAFSYKVINFIQVWVEVHNNPILEKKVETKGFLGEKNFFTEEKAMEYIEELYKSFKNELGLLSLKKLGGDEKLPLQCLFSISTDEKKFCPIDVNITRKKLSIIE